MSSNNELLYRKAFAVIINERFPGLFPKADEVLVEEGAFPIVNFRWEHPQNKINKHSGYPNFDGRVSTIGSDIHAFFFVENRDSSYFSITMSPEMFCLCYERMITKIPCE